MALPPSLGAVHDTASRPGSGVTLTPVTWPGRSTAVPVAASDKELRSPLA